MPGMTLACEGCGGHFFWSEEEQKEYRETVDPPGDAITTEPYCKMCRPKQDGQRS